MNRLPVLRKKILMVILPLLFVQCATILRKPPYRLNKSVPSRNIKVDSTTRSDSAMESLIAPYRKELNATMGKVVGQAAVDLYRGKPEAPLNNFVADLMLKRASRELGAPVDAAITNVGGLRVNIPAGPITLGKIYEVMPFENELVVLKLSGLQMYTLARQIGEVHGECIAGMTLEFSGDRLTHFTVGGKPVDNGKTYTVVTTDYLSAPGRKRLSVLGSVPRRFIGVKLRDAILDEVESLQKQGKPVTARIEGRIVFHQDSKQ